MIYVAWALEGKAPTKKVNGESVTTPQYRWWGRRRLFLAAMDELRFILKILRPRWPGVLFWRK